VIVTRAVLPGALARPRLIYRLGRDPLRAAMPELFTIGYEGSDADSFRTALKDAGVTLLADVRAVALSRKRGFSKNVLRDALAEDEIGYRHFRELGTPKAGREAARAGDAARMYEIFCDEVLTTVAARDALDAIAELAARQPVCLLCFERDPKNCHRRILSDRLKRRGFKVTDLFPPEMG
jgi:uncharacterized protein (DUF488 family)